MVRLESGAGQTSEVVDLGDMARQAIDLYDEAFINAGVRLEWVIEEDLQAEIIGRSSLIVRAIADLLSNALRHTLEEGMVSLLLICSETFYRLTIADTGGGVVDSGINRLARASRGAAVGNTSGSG